MLMCLGRIGAIGRTRGAVSVPAPAPTPTPTPTPYLGLVASETRIHNNATANTVRQANFRKYVVATEDLTAIGAVFPNWYWNPTTRAEQGSGGTLTVTAAVEFVDGAVVPLTVAGSASGTAANGDDVQTDVVALGRTVTAGTGFWIRGYMVASVGVPFDNSSLATATQVANGTFAQSKGDCFEYSATVTNRALTAGPFTSTGNTAGAPMYGPVAVIGETIRPSVLVVGDSISWGARNTFIGFGAKGIVAPSIGSAFGLTNTGSYGDYVDAFTANGGRRAALKRFCTHVVVQTGVNSIRTGSGQGKTAAQMQSDLAALYGLFSDKKVLQTTLTVSPGATAELATLNDWIRTAPVPLVGYYDIADVVMTARNSNVAASGLYDADGLHPSTAGIQAVLDSGIMPAGRIAR